MINGLAEKLKNLRLKRKVSQKELADCLNVSPSIISGYELGDRTPSAEKLLALAYFYNCSVDDLLGKSQEEPVTQIDTTGLSEEQIQALANIARLMKKA